jgi:hypothetical protein
MPVTTRNTDWTELKTHYMEWRAELYKATQELLTSSDRIELANYNDKGYFHHVRDVKLFEQMQALYEKEKSVPDEWISKGNFPGIWTAMFDPQNTFSIASLPVCIARFHFKEGYSIYDKFNPMHKELWESWDKKSKDLWNLLRNDSKDSLEKRMKSYGYPHLKGFYEENKFGAVIGYSDYISPVIVLGSSISKVEFFKIK